MSELDIFPRDPEPFVALTKTHTKAVLDCCFSPLTNQILTAGEDGKVVLWNIPPTGTELHDETINDEHKLVCYKLEEHKTPVMSVAMRGDLFISASKGGQVMLWRLQPNVQREPISGPTSYTCHTGTIFSCSISSDLKIFATGSNDRSIKIWSTESKNKSLFTLAEAHHNWIKCVQWSKIHDRLLASCGDDGRLCIWDARERKPPCIVISPPRKTSMNCLDWHPLFEHHIVVGSQDCSCSVWDLRNFRSLPKRVQIYAEHEAQVNSVAFNPGGSLLLSGSADKSSRIYDCLEGRNIFNLLAHKSSITSTCFDSTGELFATASVDRTVTIWKRNFDTVTIVPDLDDGEPELNNHGQSHDYNHHPSDLVDDWQSHARPSRHYHRNGLYQR